MQVLARQSLEKRKAAAESAAPAFEIRRLQTFVDDTFPPHAAETQQQAAVRTITVAVTIVNPHARSYSDEIDDLFAIGTSVGKMLGRKLSSQHPGFAISACGKAAIVGRRGELEHAVGLTGAGFEAAVRQSLHLGSGNMPAERRLVAQRNVARVPLASVAADSSRRDERVLEICFGAGPREDEVIVILAVSGTHLG
jgi:hypothetical protein